MVNGLTLAGLCCPLNFNKVWFSCVCVYMYIYVRGFWQGVGLCVYFVVFVGWLGSFEGWQWYRV